MVSAATLHAFSTELLVGSMTFSVLATLLCLGESVMHKFGTNILRGLDHAAYFSAIFSLCCIPLVAITGNASGDTSTSPYLVNKTLLSGLCLGLWVGVIHGRYSWGADLWANRKMSIFHSILVCLGYSTAAMLGSIGSLMTRGETVGDLLGIWPHLESAPSISFGLSMTLALFSLTTLLVVIFVQPKGKNVET
ncbi:MAG: hypothetical protein VYC11_06360 [Candidatus Thermoplasmatota archaeon]|nr:hypothetical protein [Candidatus Thermoplasmatota archaeon]MED5486317.1 hypothetical protein [Candidatus Thermoplasmatota archaeon]